MKVNIEIHKRKQLYGIRAHDLFDTGAALLLLGLNEPTKRGHCVDL